MSGSLRIAIEANLLTRAQPTGVHRYIRELSSALAAELAPEGGRIDLVYSYKRFPHRGRLPETAALRRRLRIGDWWPQRASCDCVLWPHRKALAAPGVPAVLTVHDLYAEQGVGLGERWDEGVIRDRVQALARAARIICVSEATRRDLVARYPEAAGRASVVHHGVEPRFAPSGAAAVAALRQRYGLQRPFVLFIGGNRPNKNLARLVAAYRASRIADDHDLVIAGPLFDAAARAQLAGGAGNVAFIGFAPDAILPDLYSAAAAFAIPSLHEGFCLPILEAMRCGTPVLVSGTGAAPEVAAGHAVVVDPYAVESIRDGLEAVVGMAAGRIAAAARHAQSKTWQETARQTLAVIRSAIAAV